ncbi:MULTISPECIES: Bax inhibitor-1/YccA family protein [Arthrobacter]|uniref:Bax inhibitor-1/YccA family protein n=2 Tax=Arthrobacter TaxID=1663 RepID=A0ABU9KKI2_9MICC|nr:Bax inhibitor-1/YccA family protein [Arthrobacter sp. YJM1]MDP5227408.1 Bax inhibitor-1/YccA family protein [Arthrobacter sp. YJM1]
MAAGGNPIFNGKNFRGALQAPPPPNAQNQYGQTHQIQQELSAAQLQQMYSQPSAGPAQTGRMTFDDVIIKTLLCLGAVLVGAAITWFSSFGVAALLMVVGALGGFVLAMVNTFKKEPVPALILSYAGLEGLFLGGLTKVLEARLPGIGLQAVIATLAVFAVTLLLFTSGKVRATPKMMRFFLIAMLGYAAFSLVNLFLMIFGVVQDPWGLRGSVHIFGIPLGVFVGLLAVVLAAFSLIMDFTNIEAGVHNGAPARYSWTAAFGLTVTLVWLYVELLRLIAILRGND